MTVTATPTTSHSTTVAAAAGELGSAVLKIGRQVDGSAELARNAVSEADRTVELVPQPNAVTPTEDSRSH